LAALIVALVAATAPASADAKLVRVFTVSPKLDAERWLDTQAHFRDKFRALFDRRLRGKPGVPLVQRAAGDVASHLLGPSKPLQPVRTARDLVTLPEDAGFWAMLIGSRGATARSSPTSVGAVASLLGSYGPQIAYYQDRYPELGSRGLPARLLILALTDTYARAAVETFAGLADRYDVYLVAGVTMARHWRVVCDDRAAFNSADPPRLPGGVRCAAEDPAAVAALGDPDEPARDYAYEATGPDAVNMGLVFDPNGRLISKQAKAYLTPIELPGVGLDLKPGRVSGLGAVRTPVGTLGIVTSKDSWMPDVQAKLEQRGVDLLIQPEYFTGDVAGASGRAPWPADTLRASGFNDVLRRPGFEAMAMPELTGNFADLAADQQSQSVVRVRSKRARPERALIGQHRARGFAAISDWVVPDSLRRPIARRRAALREAGEKLLPGSGVACPDPAKPGPCENGQVEGVLFKEVRVHRHPRLRPYRGPRSRAALARNHPVARSSHPQRNVDLAAAGRLVVAAFEERVGGRWRVLIARSADGGRTFDAPHAIGGPGAQWNPSVAVSGGHVFCAWTDRFASGKQRVLIAVSRDGGRSFGQPRTPLKAFTAGGIPSGLRLQWTPELAPAPEQGAHLVYLEERRLSSDDSLPLTDVFYSRLNRNGNPSRPHWIDTAAPVEMAAKLDQSWAPDIAAGGKRVAIAWVDFHTYDWRPYARLSSDGGRTFGPEREVSDSGPQFDSGAVTEQLADSPSVAIDGGRTLVAWTDWRKETATFARVSRDYDTWLSSSTGGDFGPEARADTLGARQASSFWPALATKGGQALVAWQDSSTGTGDIRLSRLHSGHSARRSIRVDNTGRASVNQYRPAIAIAGRRVVVAWEDERDGPMQVYFASAPAGVAR
jgi:predicted amidohydrolase